MSRRVARSPAFRPSVLGRTMVLAAIVGFVLVCLGVIWRRAYGIQQRRGIQELLQQLSALRADELKTMNQIRRASSRAYLVPLAMERLQMRIPDDSQVVMLIRPAPAPSAAHTEGLELAHGVR